MNSLPIINIVGCGRVGKTLGKLLHQKQLAQIQDIVNVTLKSAQQAVNFIGAGTACQNLESLRSADIYLMTTPDHVIQFICEQLLTVHIPKVSAMFVQCSGILSAAKSMPTAKAKGYQVVSVHPLKSFADPNKSVETFDGTYCALEGNANAIEKCDTLLTALGAKTFIVNSKQKALYHAAAVMASNYVVTLHDIAEKTFMHAGIDKTTATHITHSLMQGTLNNLENLTAKEALTGPMYRGELNTIQQHVMALLNYPQLFLAYQALGINTLSLTEHTHQKKHSLLQELKKLPKEN